MSSKQNQPKALLKALLKKQRRFQLHHHGILLKRDSDIPNDLYTYAGFQMFQGREVSLLWVRPTILPPTFHQSWHSLIDKQPEMAMEYALYKQARNPLV